MEFLSPPIDSDLHQLVNVICHVTGSSNHFLGRSSWTSNLHESAHVLRILMASLVLQMSNITCVIFFVKLSLFSRTVASSSKYNDNTVTFSIIIKLYKPVDKAETIIRLLLINRRCTEIGTVYRYQSNYSTAENTTIISVSSNGSASAWWLSLPTNNSKAKEHHFSLVSKCVCCCGWCGSHDSSTAVINEDRVQRHTDFE